MGIFMGIYSLLVSGRVSYMTFSPTKNQFEGLIKNQGLAE